MIESEEDELNNPNEDKIQADLWIHIWNELPDTQLNLFAVPNGGSRDPIEAMKLKATGTLAGVTDMVFYWQGRVYWLELKDSAGRTSKNQEFFHENLKLHSFEVFIIRTWREGFKIIKSIVEAHPLSVDQKKQKQDLMERRRAYLKVQKQKRRY